ncbi:MAG: response regulator, partial [Dehalococcoidales bacterium]|nr:response regulator [Dehalococcoidales bacterium]
MVSKEYTTRGNVLIVSDDHEASITLANLLRNSGYFCNLTTCANDALSVLSALAYDVVIIDLALTGENCNELLKTVRAKYPQTAIIMIASKDSINSAVVAMESGANDYVIKPLD